MRKKKSAVEKLKEVLELFPDFVTTLTILHISMLKDTALLRRM
jgi:hypothetical protein